MKALDKILLTVGIFILIFEITMIILFCRYQCVPDTLIQYTLGTGGIEAIMCAIIKVFKLKNDKVEETLEAIEE